MSAHHYERILWVNIPVLVTSTLKSVWEGVPRVREADQILIPLGCYGGVEGKKLYDALRATKRALYIEGSALTNELDNAIAWARGIHCGRMRSLSETAATDNYYNYMLNK
jgi:hypothetical protein